MDNLKKYIFICGLHRSGTSILYKIIGSSPKISNHTDTNVPEDEGQHIQSVYPPAYTYGGPGKFCMNEQCYYIEDSELSVTGVRKILCIYLTFYFFDLFLSVSSFISG
jgi:hypothetical protein